MAAKMLGLPSDAFGEVLALRMDGSVERVERLADLRAGVVVEGVEVCVGGELGEHGHEQAVELGTCTRTLSCVAEPPPSPLHCKNIVK